MAKSEQVYNHFLEYQLICTDSRKIVKDCIFFALRGDNFNGNLYALSALDQGASFVVVDEKINSSDDRILLVEDVLKYLQQFANLYRSRFEIPVIAITGSNGKTTTKELMASVLSAKFQVLYTEGNLNNHIGVPLTLLRLTAEHEIAIIEMGANHKKEISLLCRIAEPTHGLITNIGKAHLEGFGGLEGVRIGKGELFDYLSESRGVAFINNSEESVSPLLKSRDLIQVNYSNHSMKDGFIDAELIESEPCLRVNLKFYDETNSVLNTNLTGSYNVMNIINAISIGIYFRIPIDAIIGQIEGYTATNNRSQIVKQGSNTFLLDAYNANPTSMQAAIENFNRSPHLKKVAILGDMYELGEYADQEHMAIAKLALAADFEKVIFVGKHFPNPDFENITSLKEWFVMQQWEECYFLLKGSRGIALEKLLD